VTSGEGPLDLAFDGIRIPAETENACKRGSFVFALTTAPAVDLSLLPPQREFWATFPSGGYGSLDVAHPGAQIARDTDAPEEATGPELVIGLAGAVGTDLGMVTESLSAALDEVAYRAEIVRLSALLEELDWDRELPEKPLDEHISKHMDAGDELRETGRAVTRWP
jgi:hypothetical protein